MFFVFLSPSLFFPFFFLLLTVFNVLCKQHQPTTCSDKPMYLSFLISFFFFSLLFYHAQTASTVHILIRRIFLFFFFLSVLTRQCNDDNFQKKKRIFSYFCSEHILRIGYQGRNCMYAKTHVRTTWWQICVLEGLVYVYEMLYDCNHLGGFAPWTPHNSLFTPYISMGTTSSSPSIHKCVFFNTAQVLVRIV